MEYFHNQKTLTSFGKIRNGSSLITEIPNDRFDWHDYNDSHMKWGAFLNHVKYFDADYFNMSRQEADVLDPQHRMFMQVVWNTIEDAGYKPSSLSERTLVYL